MRLPAVAAVVFAITSTAMLGHSQVTPAVRNQTRASAGEVAAGDLPSGAPVRVPAVSSDFVIGSGDILQVSVWQEPQFGETVEVRPDGKISLPLVSDVQVAGFTTDGAQNKISDALEQFVKHPIVSVIVTQVHSKLVYVIGQVERPGEYPLLGATTVSELIAEAGGATSRAKKKDVYLLRAGNSKRFPINYKRILEGKDRQQNAELGTGDTVVVP
jgi:polysaccharide export outer membrane protein